MRVALVRGDTNTARAIADALIERLRFNGKTVVENGDALFKDFAAPEGPDPAVHRALAQQVAAFRPHVVLFIARPSMDDVVLGIEETWPRGAGSRPVYVSGAPWEGDELLAFVGADAGRRRRFLAVTPVVKTAANVRFVQRFNAAFAQKVTLADAPNNAYDAFYVLAYAAAAAGAPLTGARLAAAVPRLLPPGTRIDVGAAGIFPALRALSDGEHVDVNGASGPLDFDVKTGEAEQSLAILCMGADEQGGAAAVGVESGMVYDAATRTLSGKLRCP
jgi:branched-chain amino acid transport system substrate-binding protein